MPRGSVEQFQPGHALLPRDERHLGPGDGEQPAADHARDVVQHAHQEVPAGHVFGFDTVKIIGWQVYSGFAGNLRK